MLGVSPGADLFEYYEGLIAEKAGEKKADTVLIMLTTSLNPDDEKRTLAIPEVSGFEHKPLNQIRLESLLQKYFSN